MSAPIISTILIFIIWMFAGSRGGDKVYKIMKEVQLDYKDLLKNYKITWSFDDLDLPPQQKNKLKFNYEEIYSKPPEKGNSSIQAWVLIIFVVLAFIVSFLAFQVFPAIFGPALTSVSPEILDGWLRLLAIGIPVGFLIYAYWAPRWLRFGVKDEFQDVMKRELFQIEKAVEKLDEQSDDEQKARLKRLEKEYPQETQGVTTVVKGNVVQSSKKG